MSMGTREDGKQGSIWVEASEVARGEVTSSTAD
jgi:hypothetical protein